MDDDSKLTLHGLQQHYVKLKDNEKNRKLFELLDALEFNQVRDQSKFMNCVHIYIRTDKFCFVAYLYVRRTCEKMHLTLFIVRYGFSRAGFRLLCREKPKKMLCTYKIPFLVEISGFIINFTSSPALAWPNLALKMCTKEVWNIISYVEIPSSHMLIFANLCFCKKKI